MSFLQRGLLLFAVAESVLFVTGNGQFVVSSPFYAGSSAFREVPRGAFIREVNPITGTTITSSFTNEGDNIIHTKKIVSDKRNKNWMELETDEVSESVPSNVYGYPNNEKTASQNEVRVKYFNTITPPQQTFQEEDTDSNVSPFKALLALRTLASQLGNLLFFLERAPVPLSMFMLSGALNIKQESKPHSEKPMSLATDDTSNKPTSVESTIVEKAIIAEPPPIIMPFGMPPPPVEPIPSPGSLSQYFSNLSGPNSDNLKTSESKTTSEDAYRNGMVGNQLPNELHRDMYLPEFSNDIPRPGNPRYGRRPIDNNLRQVQDVPYTGFFPDYNAANPYPAEPYPGYYNNYEPMKSPYVRPKENPKKAWKKEQKKLLKEKVEGNAFEDDDLRKSRQRKNSKNRRNEIKRKEVDDYMFWPPPPSYAI